ncbi:dynein heavy chain, partial [Strigomonas culicis]
MSSKSTKKDFRYTAPKATQDHVHRNPAHVAKDAQDMYGGVNPLVHRLYCDGATSSNDLGVPGRLTSLSAHAQSAVPTVDDAAHASSAPPSRGAETHPVADAAASAGASRGNTTFVNSLQVFQPPSYQDDDLKRIFTTSSQQGAMSMPKKRPAPPPKLQPLSAKTKTEAADAADETCLAASRIPRFVKATSNSPNEFAYMVMRPRGIRDRFNPYDLQVVTHKDLDPRHYFTVSASGVTQFVNGAAEFIELPTWERECRVFDRLSELPIFRDYKKWRSFLLWRALVRRQAMTKCSSFLTSNLLYIHPNLSGTLQSVRKICLDFLATNNLYVPATETRTLEGYCGVLRQHLDKERGRIERMIKIIREKVEQACKAAMVTAQMERDASKLSKDEDAVRKKKKVVDIRELGTMQQPSYIEVAQRKATCQRLTAFIRLCDYLVITCLTRLADKAIEAMQEDLEYPKKERPVAASEAREKEKNKKKEEVVFNGALLSIEVQFNEEESIIEITPSHDLVLESVEDMIRDYVRTVGGVPRLVSMDTFKAYTDQAQDNMNEATGGPEVAEMVVSEQCYKENVARIRDHLATAFEDVEHYV